MQFSRTQLLFGEEAMEKLKGSRVAVFGIGGVGGYCVEALARSGVGTLDLIDDDTVNITNLNRQIIATHDTVDKLKVDVIEERIHAINPACRVGKFPVFYLPEEADAFDLSAYDYVVDCIDTVTAKLDLIRRCHTLGVPILCSMGAAFKVDATQFTVTDLSKTINDPLAKVIRQKLRKENIRHVKVVYSPEVPLPSLGPGKTPPSNAWVPAVAGLIAGGEVVKDLIKKAGTWRTESGNVAGIKAGNAAG